MFSLSARFSESSFFAHVAVKERGIEFANSAQAIYDEWQSHPEDGVPLLRWVQGCILVAYYNQSSRSAWDSMPLIEACAELARKLGLDRVSSDLDPSQTLDSQDWIAKEEQRRAWWSIWELDAFNSVVSRRPLMINLSHSHTSLPVSDEVWYTGVPVASARFHADPLLCWKSLRDTPDKDERAWFLISNYIMVQTYALGFQTTTNDADIDKMETVIACFALLYEERFPIPVGHLVSRHTDCTRRNWVVFTYLMIY